MKVKYTLFLLSFLVYFLGWALVYFSGVNRLLIQSEDTLPAMFLPVALIKDHTIYLDNYYTMLVKRYPQPDDKKQLLGLTPFYLKKVDGHYLSAFPLVSGVLAIPIYLVPILFGTPITWFNLSVLAKIAAVVIVSLSGVILYKLLLYFLDEKKSIYVTLVYLFATINFASISQALWQHGTLELFTMLALLYLVKSEKNVKNLGFSGLFMGLAILSRPTAALPFAILCLYVFKKFKGKGVVSFAAPVLIPVMFFLFYNFAFYKNISNQGYASQLFTSWRTPIYKGFFGTWFSPSKGILVYSPVFIFSVIGAYLAFKRKDLVKNIKDIQLFRYTIVIVLTHTLIVSMWKHWYGGWSFGYRMSSDIIPYLSLLLVPYFNSSLYEKTKKWFALAFVWSLGIELMGMAFFDGIWHAAYDKGFINQGWLWSIQNSEMVFYIKRVLLKLHLIKPFLP